MSTGKASAQAAHAAIEAFRVSDPSMLHEWYLGGHYTKLVMAGEDETHMRTIQHYIEERGFKTKLIIDEGRTEVRPHTVTALGVEIVDKDDQHAAATFVTFKIYRDLPRPLDLVAAYNAVGAHGHLSRRGRAMLAKIKK